MTEIAVLLPEKTQLAADQLAARLQMSRSDLVVQAVEAFLARYNDEATTAALNRVYGEQQSLLDEDLQAVARRKLEQSQW
jgi:metal-responsive CopG/Arc/MetJ family transcriptional regulator